ncbi:MAG: B12-binding domain-containing radical SAM protein, partial [Deltaproteobacteria bacterium]
MLRKFRAGIFAPPCEGLPMNADSSVPCEAISTFPPLGKQIKVLMVWPAFPPSFWSFAGMMQMLDEKVVMPPLGLVTVAALCPKEWTIRLIDQQVESVSDEDIRWADLVMTSGMKVQRKGMEEILTRARALGRRTVVGGPYASGEPETLLKYADHVVAGEPDEVFDKIARDFENGAAQRLYQVEAKPDMTRVPVPRFDLLKTEYYASMPIQFSRGCPFTCEFCDIIILYGRKPRAKRPTQIRAELDALLRLGWKKQVFIVDDNFIGNHKLALELSGELERWQNEHGYPLAFYTEASMDLAQRPALMDAMVRANFFYVFLGIESPSKESLTETKKFQNLRLDPVESIKIIQRAGLWVTGGFIVGFDSDPEDIFECQIQFIEEAAVPWAMMNFLHAVPLTPLHDRMKREGRLIEHSINSSDSTVSNFRTIIPLPVLVRGYQKTLRAIYDPDRFFARAWRSLEDWRTAQTQHPAKQPGLAGILRILVRSLWRQGLRSSYKR